MSTGKTGQGMTAMNGLTGRVADINFFELRKTINPDKTIWGKK